MKVKFSNKKGDYLGVTEGHVYDVINNMPSESGGQWVEFRNDIGLIALAKVGGFGDAFGTWEIVSE